jgi:metallo-beta-lactamase class B
MASQRDTTVIGSLIVLLALLAFPIAHAQDAQGGRGAGGRTGGAPGGGRNATPPTPAKPDNDKVKEHWAAANRLAGKDWIPAAHFQCAPEAEVTDRLPPRVRTQPDVNRDPVKVFDNLYFVGEKADVTWILSASDGLIMLDSGFPDRVETTLLAGMKTLRLDPARLKYILIGHEHQDHYGGSPFLQANYPGVRVGMSEQAWKAFEPGAPRTGPMTAPGPKKDLVIKDGEPIVLGDVRVIPVFTPGHTPGSMAFIFPVREGGRTHMAALFGGTMLTIGANQPVAVLEQYLEGLKRWEDATRRMKVEVQLISHPLFDGLFDKLEQLTARKPGDRHPMVVGTDAYQRFVGIMRECTLAHMARRQ